MRPRPLLLLDCDGSLFAGQDEAALRCFDDALEELSGRLWPPGVFRDRDPARTVRGVVRELGVDPDAWLQRVLELYFDRFDERDVSDWNLREDVEPTLRRLALEGFELGLVSTRPEAIVRFRFERLGLGGYFPHGAGAFGCEADRREDLLRLALWRSACTPRRAVQVADSLRAVVAARRLGLGSIAVGSLSEVPPVLVKRPAA
jgi:phosphoglycolate phosphatase-like HAD superfamily hydrolase